MNLTQLPAPERLNNTYSPRREETLGEMLSKRNSQLLKLFRDTPHQVKLIGDAEKPDIILNDKIRLTAYAHNFELRFTDSPVNGATIYTVKINASNHIPQKFFEVFLKEVEQLPVKPKRKRLYKPVIEKVSRSIKKITEN